MDNLKKTLTSGASLEVSIASFKDGHKLTKAVMKELGSVRLSMGMKSGKEVTDLLNQEVNEDLLNTMKNVMATMIGSEEVEAALWPCMERASWNKRKCNADLFEDVKAREDFFEVAREVLLFNLRPFTKSLFSSFSMLLRETSSSQK